MREIKFRVWYKDKMWLPEGIQSYSDFMVSAFGGVFFMNEPGYHNGKDHSAVLMQYTGLKDKNGKEIYDGDIVRYSRWDRPVFWGPAAWVIELPNDECEVIGNIYENPELFAGILGGALGAYYSK